MRFGKLKMLGLVHCVFCGMEVPLYGFYFRFGDSQDKTNLSNSLTPILRLLMASLTIFLMSVGIIFTCILFLASLQPFHVFLHLFIIALTVLSGLFNRLCIVYLFCTHYQTCDGQLPSVSSELTVFWFLPC